MSNNMSDLFNLSSDFFKDEQKSTASNDLYKPNAKDSQDGVYKAIIRFVPWHKEPKKSKVKKFQVWLSDPATNKGFYVDCPSSIGLKSIITDTFWKLKNSSSAADKKLSESFSRKEWFYAPIQIVKDKQRPELEGKIVIFRFGKSVDAKIQAEMEPEYGKPCVPFDLFEGKLFALHITKKGEWNNYDLCKFVGDPEPIKVDGAPIAKDKVGFDKVTKYLQDNTPDFTKYYYQEWTEETYEKVANVIKNSIPSGEIVSQVFKANGINKPVNSTPPAAKNNESKPAQSVDDFDLTADLSSFESSIEGMDFNDSSSSSNDLDDLYNNL